MQLLFEWGSLALATASASFVGVLVFRHPCALQRLDRLVDPSALRSQQRGDVFALLPQQSFGIAR